MESAHTKLLHGVHRSNPERSTVTLRFFDYEPEPRRFASILPVTSYSIVTSYSMSDLNLRRLKANELGLFFTPRYGLTNDLDLARSKFDTELSDSFEMLNFV